jgi:hypothetical protein
MFNRTLQNRVPAADEIRYAILGCGIFKIHELDGSVLFGVERAAVCFDSHGPRLCQQPPAGRFWCASGRGD